MSSLTRSGISYFSDISGMSSVDSVSIVGAVGLNNFSSGPGILKTHYNY